MAHKRPLGERASSIRARGPGIAAGLRAADGVDVDAAVLEEGLRGERQARGLQAHVLVGAEALVDPFEGEAEAVGAVGGGWWWGDGLGGCGFGRCVVWGGGSVGVWCLGVFLVFDAGGRTF